MSTDFQNPRASARGAVKDNTQPEALRLAKALEYCDASVARQAINELRRQHARIAELEAQLASIGAGGVSGPLMGKPQEMPDLSALTERGAKAWAGVDAQGLREGRWYMVTHDGAATLCVDEADAQEEAKKADREWPRNGPHRAVQLVEAGFTAADMASASAQGFRDGVASAAAPAAQAEGWRLVPVEPTAEMLRAGDQKTWVLPALECWRAMLAAAPTPPTSAEGVEHG